MGDFCKRNCKQLNNARLLVLHNVVYFDSGSQVAVSDENFKSRNVAKVPRAQQQQLLLE